MVKVIFVILYLIFAHPVSDLRSVSGGPPGRHRPYHQREDAAEKRTEADAAIL